MLGEPSVPPESRHFHFRSGQSLAATEVNRNVIKPNMNYHVRTFAVTAVAFGAFLLLGASVADAVIWCGICVVFSRASGIVDKIADKSANPKSELYSAVYFGVAIATMLLIYLFVPDTYFTLSLILFLAGVLAAQYLALRFFGIPAEKNSTAH